MVDIKTEDHTSAVLDAPTNASASASVNVNTSDFAKERSEASISSRQSWYIKADLSKARNLPEEIEWIFAQRYDRKGKGVKAGTGRGPRKDTGQLSRNAKTVRNREAEKDKSWVEQELSKIEKADKDAIRSRIQTLKKTDSFKSASEEQQTDLVEQKREEVMDDRFKRHMSCMNWTLTFPSSNGLLIHS